jgi:cytoskeletal protein RodZ
MNNRVKPIHNSRIRLGKKMETVGDAFKKARIKQGKDLQTISLDTKIDVKKLKALEENDFKLFDSPVGTKGFIKIYAEYLQLDPEKILAIYRRDFGEKRPEYKVNAPKEKEEKNLSLKYLFLLIPIILLMATLVYMYNHFSDFQNPPNLEILTPENNSVIEEDILEIRGITDHDAIVEIGNSKVPVDEKGGFTTKVPMKQGDNTITIRTTSARNPSRESVEILYITYVPKEEEIIEEIEDEKIEEITLNVKVENSPTWVEIVIDDQFVVSQVLPVGYDTDFVGERNVSVNTSILQNVKVEINNDSRGLSSETFSIRCEIVEGELECK